MDITKKLIEDLNSINKPRVWSIVITIFGDCAILRGGTIAMSELQEITTLLQIEPGALRTAMSRLAKENWVVRKKVGRNSFYKLSSDGFKSFSEPTSKIYAKDEIKADEGFFLGIKEATIMSEAKVFTEFLRRTGSICLSKNIFFIPKNYYSDDFLKKHNVFIVKGFEKNLPDWVGEKLFPNQIKRSLLGLMKKYKYLNNESASNKIHSPSDALIIRILLIHEWRRIILRLPTNPLTFSPADWPLEDCRHLVKSIYQKVIPPSERWWITPLKEREKNELFSRFM